MDFLQSEFISSLLSIIMIDIVLGGDNAILIALATKNLPKYQVKKAIFWGVVGAITVRAALTMVAVYVLSVPLIQFIGGVLLIWIAYKLLVDEGGHDNVQSGNSLREAIKMIVVADLLMGIDNVLAVAGAAHDSPLLVVLGLLISVPIIVWGSSIILVIIGRFPVIIYIGAAVIAWTSGNMIIHDKYIHDLVITKVPSLEILIPVVITIGVLIIGYANRKKTTTNEKE